MRLSYDDEIRKHLHWDSLDAPEEWKRKFFELCCAYREIFTSQGNMGKLQTVQLSIDTGLADPIKSRPYRMTPAKRAFICDAVKKMLDNGVIEPSCSPWSAPIVLIEKKEKGSYSFCTDYRGLNVVTRKDRYPLPRIDKMLEKLKGAELFTTFDLASGYRQIPIYPPHKEKTAFVTHCGFYQYRVMPFSLTNAPATFQWAIEQIFGECPVFIDDVIVCSTSHEQHLQDIHIFLTWCVVTI